MLNKSRFSVVLIALMVSSLVLFSAMHFGVAQTTWVVSSQGNADFTTIQAAINAASPGDTVEVMSGTYYEHLTIDKTLTLLGENRETTIIDAGGVNPASTIIVSANDVTISGFTIQHALSGGRAIWVDGYNGTVISNNIITNNGDGIRLLNSNGNLVEGNLIENNPYTSLGFDWTFNNVIYNNTILDNYIGVGAGGGDASYDCIFANNTISGNSYGFLIDIYDSIFFHNIIIGNTVQAEFYNSADSNKWDDGSSVGGNYWSDYTGTGNSPYVINANNIDNYPFMSPSLIPPTPQPTFLLSTPSLRQRPHLRLRPRRLLLLPNIASEVR